MSSIVKGCVVTEEDEAYLEEIIRRRWPDARKKCDGCRSEATHVRVPGRSAFACQLCHHQAYPLADTIFEGSTTRLSLWFEAWYLYSSDFRIPATLLKRKLGVTYKTARRMLVLIHSTHYADHTAESFDPRDEVDSRVIDTIVYQAEHRGRRALPERSRMTGNANAVTPRFIRRGSRRLRRITISGADVFKFAKAGYTVDAIAMILHCNSDSLLRYYKKEIDEARSADDVIVRHGKRRYRQKRNVSPSDEVVDSSVDAPADRPGESNANTGLPRIELNLEDRIDLDELVKSKPSMDPLTTDSETKKK